MSEFRRIIMSSFLMLLLHFPANGEYFFFTVRVGDEVTLPCDNVIHDQDKCDSTTWLFSDSSATVELVHLGRIGKEAKAKSDGLRVTENCSLVIKKVTEEDAGQYACRQFKKAVQQQRPDSLVDLFVVTSTQLSPTTTQGWIIGNIITSKGWWRLLIVSVGLTALLLSVAQVNIWIRTKGNLTQMEENMEQNDEDEDEVDYENDGEPSASV
ncbi:uncharacterized protein LOC117487006 isoform X2 [Trematomus bernacchii]|uniref:uncharacterized protein LOC117487006 isoform X2 n=1 Tax=Trematomus bernacchii TaxID=40690 RepID=UPI00146B83B6|nr:uncharacterized protein LOC117487006 isoform X2 [Trematomus bernacchii]